MKYNIQHFLKATSLHIIIIIIIILFIYFMLFLQMQGAHSLLQAHCYKLCTETLSPSGTYNMTCRSPGAYSHWGTTCVHDTSRISSHLLVTNYTCGTQTLLQRGNTGRLVSVFNDRVVSDISVRALEAGR